MGSDVAGKWRSALGDLHTWKRGGERAPHKPLLALMLIARAEMGQPNQVRFLDIRDSLDRLLLEFGPVRKSRHPELPFWHLQYDGIWVVENAEKLPPKKAGHSPARSTLERNDATGHVPDDLWHSLTTNPDLRQELTQQLLDAFWPETLHAGIRQAIGLPDKAEAGSGSVRVPRDPRFREEVLRAYERRCAVCGYDGRISDVLFGLDAAHIRWHAYDGPDTIANGLALCSYHHVAFDSGALGITTAGRILVSSDATGSDAVKDYLFRFSGRPVRPPQSGFAPPDDEFVGWHRKQVFRAPPRVTPITSITRSDDRAAEDQASYR